MPYRFAPERQDFADYAAGKVFYGLPGYPAFPVRLASEMFQRCIAVRAARNLTAPVTVYDPCCGGAYHLSTLAYLHWDAIAAIVASDIDNDAVALARRNLNLLTLDGLEQRIAEIREMLDAYGKTSHAEALASAEGLRQRLAVLTGRRPLSTEVFRADALDSAAICATLKPASVDVVLTDVPYGRHSAWQNAEGLTSSPLWQMLESLRSVLAPGAVVAIASDKGQTAEHAAFRRVDRFQIGKRRIVLLTPDS
jgi:SAM-dependent methyltransferase